MSPMRVQSITAPQGATVFAPDVLPIRAQDRPGALLEGFVHRAPRVIVGVHVNLLKKLVQRRLAFGLFLRELGVKPLTPPRERPNPSPSACQLAVLLRCTRSQSMSSTNRLPAVARDRPQCTGCLLLHAYLHLRAGVTLTTPLGRDRPPPNSFSSKTYGSYIFACASPPLKASIVTRNTSHASLKSNVNASAVTPRAKISTVACVCD